MLDEGGGGMATGLLGQRGAAELEDPTTGADRAGGLFADSTLARYQSTWRRFCEWCAERGVASLPARHEDIETFIGENASTALSGRYRRHVIAWYHDYFGAGEALRATAEEFWRRRVEMRVRAMPSGDARECRNRAVVGLAWLDPRLECVDQLTVETPLAVDGLPQIIVGALKDWARRRILPGPEGLSAMRHVPWLFVRIDRATGLIRRERLKGAEARRILQDVMQGAFVRQA
jgi:hypothetical protein